MATWAGCWNENHRRPTWLSVLHRRLGSGQNPRCTPPSSLNHGVTRDDWSLVQALQALHSMPRIQAQLRVCRLRGTGWSPASPGPTVQWCWRMSSFPWGLRRKLLAGQPFRFEDAWEKSGERSLPPTHLRKANRWVKPVTQDEQMDFFLREQLELKPSESRGRA